MKPAGVVDMGGMPDMFVRGFMPLFRGMFDMFGKEVIWGCWAKPGMPPKAPEQNKMKENKKIK